MTGRLRRFALAAALAGGCATAAPRAPAAPPQPRGPVSLELPRLGGGRVSLDSYRGRPVLVVMFTTWSLRAQAEAPRFVRIAERYGRRGLALVGVALDVKTRREILETYVDFVGFRFPVAVSAPTDPALVRAFGPTRQVPRTLLLDRQGKVVLDMRGQTDFPKLAAALGAMLPAGARGR